MQFKTIYRTTLFSLFIFYFSNVHFAHAETIYSVKRGDTLWNIAMDHGVTVEDLIEWNELTSTVIFPEQQLFIYDEQHMYTVKKGDTLSEIAESFHISLTDLMAWNEIDSDLIFPGDKLIIANEDENLTISRFTNGWTKSAMIDNEQSEEKSQSIQQTRLKKKVKLKQTAVSTSEVPPIPSAAGKEMIVTATAYTAYCTGCSGTTYTGINLRTNPNQKVIAVDPNVIPLGSRVWVEGYGEAVAGDIGGAIKGNMIDVFLEHKQDALNWGRKTVKIKVLD